MFFIVLSLGFSFLQVYSLPYLLSRGRLPKRQLASLVALYLDDPLLRVADAAKKVSVSRQTVYNYLDELEETGQIHRNGQGVEVMR